MVKVHRAARLGEDQIADRVDRDEDEDVSDDTHNGEEHEPALVQGLRVHHRDAAHGSDGPQEPQEGHDAAHLDLRRDGERGVDDMQQDHHHHQRSHLPVRLLGPAEAPLGHDELRRLAGRGPPCDTTLAVVHAVDASSLVTRLTRGVSLRAQQGRGLRLVHDRGLARHRPPGAREGQAVLLFRRSDATQLERADQHEDAHQQALGGRGADRIRHLLGQGLLLLPGKAQISAHAVHHGEGPAGDSQPRHPQ
mmetsp:Transcript_71500/g.210009  ORF Transcript_71500/g.210009 Transcript_71500/m.210009 type:complete len:250 (+) Transcript_71500:517-1266(+)